jgi:hypothetical protein
VCVRQLDEFVTGLMDPTKDAAAFQTLARDFLIQLKEYNSDQWTESSLSLQLEMQSKEAEKMQVGGALPGRVSCVRVSARERVCACAREREVV